MFWMLLMTKKRRKTLNQFSLLDLAKKVFFKKYPNSQGKVADVKQIHCGYTNYSFLFTLKNKTKFQVRIPNDGQLIDRYCEYQIIKLLKNKSFVYYDVKTGIAIKKWIEGINPKVVHTKSPVFLNKLFKQIYFIHKLPKNHYSKFKTIDFTFYNTNVNQLPVKVREIYLKLYSKHKNDPVVINHSDINLANIVLSKQKEVHLIDFEWVILAPDYWDYANFFREQLLPFKYAKLLNKYIKNYNFMVFCEFVFLTTCFAYLWTFKMPQTTKIANYRKLQMKKIQKYVKYFGK